MYKIDTITDESDRVYAYEYDQTTGLLKSITVTAKGATSPFDSVSFTYNSNGQISKIEYGDGTPATTLYHGSNKLLSSVREYDTNYYIYITYTAGSIKKVKSVSEEINLNNNTASGNQLNFSYAQNQTTIQDWTAAKICNTPCAIIWVEKEVKNAKQQQ